MSYQLPIFNATARFCLDGGHPFRFGLFILAVLFFAVFFGLASAVLPPFFILFLILAPAIFLVAIFNAELALLIATAAIIGIIPSFLQPSIPIAGVSIKSGEILLLLLAFLTFLKVIYRHTGFAEIFSPLQRPLIVLGVLYAISITYSVIIKRHPFGLAETRNLIGWLALPVAIYGLRWNFRKLDIYLRTFAILTALLVVAQTVSGVQLIYSDRGAETISSEFRDVIRSTTGAGNFLIGYAMYYALGRAATAKAKALWIVLVNLLALGLLVSFTRGAWLGALTGLFVFFFITQAHRRMMGILILSGLAALVLGGGLLVAKPSLMGALGERLFSITEEGGRGSSVGHRLDENQQALRAIANNPLVGVGIGGEYKQFTSTRGVAIKDVEFTYIHNSYLGLAVKVGLLAMFIPFWIYRNLWLEWKRHKPAVDENVTGLHLNLAASLSALAMFMVNAISQPEWIRIGGIVTASLLIAIALTASSLIRQKE